jgi:hypothetical protein
MASARQVVKKIVIGSVVLLGLFALFLWTLRETESAPYLMGQSLLTGWRVTIEPSAAPDGPLLTLAPPRELTMGLFQQVFERTMESMNAPRVYGIALILQREYRDTLAGRIEPAELAELARAAGLEEVTLEPRCLAVRPGATQDEPRRIFYVVFELPALLAFREEVATRLQTTGRSQPAFEPSALAPLLYLAATDRGFREWPSPPQPPDGECVAPVELAAF